MKILIFSDLHLNTWRSFGLSEKPGITKRLNDQINVLESIKDLISKQHIDIVIFGGDLFHSVGFIPVECLNIAYSFFNWLKNNNIIYYVTHGNHDLINRETPAWYQSSVTPFVNSCIKPSNLKIRCVDWNEKIDYDELVNFDILVLHKQPSIINKFGVKFEDVNWNQLTVQNRLVFFGHWHIREILLPNCIILGSVMPLTFGDTNECGVWIVNSDDWSVEFVEIVSPKFITVETADAIQSDGNYYRVLHADKKIDNENVVTVIEPKHFEERIKSSNFDEILNEWLILNQKDVLIYRNSIEKLLEDKMQLSINVFKGRLYHVKIKDFMSIGDIEFNILDGLTFISGRNDTFDTNGSGKSSICEAIFWCLFGETTKELTGDDVIRRGFKDCSIELILIENSVKYIVNRSRKRGLTIQRIENENLMNLTEGRKLIECQNILESILGFDKNIFLASCYFSQESLSLFTQLEDTDRTNMITHLLGFETYDNLYERIKNLIDAKLSEKESLNLEIDNSNRKIELFENDKNGILIRLGEISNEILDCENKLSRISRESNNYKIKLNELKNSEKTQVDLSALNVQINENLLDIEKCNTQIDVLTENERDWIQKSNEIKTQRIQIQSKINSISDKISDLSEQIVALHNSEIGSKCDKCGSLISLENVESFVSEKTQAIVELQILMDEYQNHIEKFEKDLSCINSEIPNVRNSITEFKSSIKLLQEKIKNLNLEKEKCLNEINVIEKEILKFDMLLQTNEKFLNESNLLLNNLNIQFGQYNNKKNLLESGIKNLEIAIVNQESLGMNMDESIEILAFWKESFSSKGIRSLLLDRFCNEFNSIINEYLSTASNGLMSVIINPIKILKSGEERNKIDFDVSLNDNVVKYKSLSGGEKRRLDICMCLALNSWVSNKFGINFGILGILILDEIFSFIDRLGEETIATLLYNESRNKSIFMISHTPELISYADRDMTIFKENGVSRLEQISEKMSA